MARARRIGWLTQTAPQTGHLWRLAADAMRTPAFWAIVTFCGSITLNQTVYQFLSSYVCRSPPLPQIAAARLALLCGHGGRPLAAFLFGSVSDHSAGLAPSVVALVGGVVGVLHVGMPRCLRYALWARSALVLSTPYTVETPPW